MPVAPVKMNCPVLVRAIFMRDVMLAVSMRNVVSLTTSPICTTQRPPPGFFE
ncbi:hypothetical protein D3C78_1712320 [compost metagenome]